MLKDDDGAAKAPEISASNCVEEEIIPSKLNNSSICTEDDTIP